MQKNNLKGVIILFITAIIWGTTFVAQSLGSDFVGPFTFNAMRFTIAGIVLLIASFVIKKVNIKKDDNFQLIVPKDKNYKSITILLILVGISLFISATFQQLGIDATKSASKSGFITTLYMVFVPLISILFGKKIKAKAIASKHPPIRIYGRRRPILVFVLSPITPISGSLMASQISEIKVTIPA